MSQIKPVSVPYRGLIFLNFCRCLTNSKKFMLVSVPYRGLIFLNMTTKEMIELSLMFPSPTGDLYFSISAETFKGQRDNCFRPLPGTYISQLEIKIYCNYGVLVSVPYRGLIFLNINHSTSIVTYIVSVPYRGLIFLNTSVSFITQHVTRPFPSPTGDLYFSIIKLGRIKNMIKFPSPTGDLYFSNHLRNPL